MIKLNTMSMSATLKQITWVLLMNLLFPVFQNPVNIPDPDQSGRKSYKEAASCSNYETCHPVQVKLVSEVINCNARKNEKYGHGNELDIFPEVESFLCHENLYECCEGLSCY